MNHSKRICVFSGSSLGNNKKFIDIAVELGTLLATNAITLIYGAGDVGLMGKIAKSSLDNGGYVIGIIPTFLQSIEGTLANLSELIVTKNIHERKEKMYQLTDIYIAFPGGLGTLEEVTEVLSWQKLGVHTKPIIFLNIDGFWNNFFKMLEQLITAGFLKKEFLTQLVVISSVAELKTKLEV